VRERGERETHTPGKGERERERDREIRARGERFTSIPTCNKMNGHNKVSKKERESYFPDMTQYINFSRLM
jgi:hypothetical protein